MYDGIVEERTAASFHAIGLLKAQRCIKTMAVHPQYASVVQLFQTLDVELVRSLYRSYLPTPISVGDLVLNQNNRWNIRSVQPITNPSVVCLM